MSKEDLLSEDKIKENVPKWVLSTGYTLLFLSVFINSIGLNLMQINGALTENVVSRIESSGDLSGDSASDDNNKNIQEIIRGLDEVATKEDVERIIKRIEELEAVSHEPTKK